MQTERSMWSSSRNMATPTFRITMSIMARGPLPYRMSFSTATASGLEWTASSSGSQGEMP